MNLEFFGGTRWVDALVRVLAAFQHSTVVSEVARDEFLQKALELLEMIRKERQEKDAEEVESDQEDQEDSDEGGDYYV